MTRNCCDEIMVQKLQIIRKNKISLEFICLFGVIQTPLGMKLT